VKIAFNFHAYGPLFITPYNWDTSKKNEDVPKAAKYFYDEVYFDTEMPDGYIEGNGSTTIGYSANGEASDWMLHEMGVFAMSPELGLQLQESETFFIKNSDDLENVIKDNSKWIWNTMKLLFEKVTCEPISSEVKSIIKNENDEELSTI